MKIFQKPSLFFNKAFNLSVLSRNRWPWVDYLRGIAIVLVVYRHVLIGIERSGVNIPDSLVSANMIFYSFRMPLFFILSGLFINSSLVKKGLKNIIEIKFENIFYPYLVWATLQITFQILFSRFTNAERTILDYTYIFYEPRNLDQFWYLPALFNVTILYVLIKTKLKIPDWSQIILGILFYYLSTFVNNISMLSDWMEFYIFFALGDVMSKKFFKESTQNFLKNNWLILAITPVFICIQVYYLTNEEVYYLETWTGKTEFILIALIGCFSMLLLSLRFQIWKIFSFLRVLGFHSLYIYVMHVFIAAFIRMIMTKIFGIYDSTILLLCGIVLSITIPVIIYNLLIKDNVLWFLFTYKKSEIKPNRQNGLNAGPNIINSNTSTPYGKEIVQ